MPRRLKIFLGTIEISSDQLPIQHTVTSKETKLIAKYEQVRNPLLHFISYDSNAFINLLCHEEFEKNIGSLEKPKDQISCLKPQFNIKQDVVTLHEKKMVQIDLPTYNDYMTAITHLFLVKSVDVIAGTKQENHRVPMAKDMLTRTETMKSMH